MAPKKNPGWGYEQKASVQESKKAGHNLCFALGPNGTYFYSTPKQRHVWWNLEGEVKEVMSDILDDVTERRDILWVALGPEKESYVISYLEFDNNVHRIGEPPYLCTISQSG